MTTQGHDAYVRTTRTLERLCRDYGFEYVLGVFSNDMPDHRRMREEEEERQRALEKMRRRQERVRFRRQIGGTNGSEASR
jgi:hypothetical protein